MRRAAVPLLIGAALLICVAPARAQDLMAGVIPGANSGMSVKSQILVLMTLLGLLPVLVMMMTSFTRFVIVLSLLRQALGLQQGLPSRIVTGIALILTLLVMRPIGVQVWNEAFLPYDQNKIGLEQALKTPRCRCRASCWPRPARARWPRSRTWPAKRRP
jgi:flagellar biosynthetic protein FliP